MIKYREDKQFSDSNFLTPLVSRDNDLSSLKERQVFHRIRIFVWYSVEATLSQPNSKYDIVKNVYRSFPTIRIRCEIWHAICLHTQSCFTNCESLV